MKKKLNIIVYTLLALLWVAAMLWLYSEHQRARATSRQLLLNRARDISDTIGVFIRSQERYGMVSRQRIESALEGLVDMRELRAVALVSREGEVVASAGEMQLLDIDPEDKHVGGWGDQPREELWMPGMSGLVMNLVDLGREHDDDQPDEDEEKPIVVMSPGEIQQSFRERRERNNENNKVEEHRDRMHRDERRRIIESQINNSDRQENNRSNLNIQPLPEGRMPRLRMPDNEENNDQTRLRRPRWMPPKEYDALRQKKGLHGFLLRLDTADYESAIARDKIVRTLIAALISFAIIMMAAAWRYFQRSSQLQMHLVRSSEMNIHLREMNLSAAGLAHETRNPLNTVRGLAQVINRQNNLSPDVRRNSQAIVEEVDRVTVRLNEFIEYSRPRDPKPALVDPLNIAAEILSALETDIEDKNIQIQIIGDHHTILADPAQLRQVLFNLLLNAIQAVSDGGQVTCKLQPDGHQQYLIKIIDNGPGVDSENRDDIFRPYFTTNEKGTGLGLAVVRQIVLAHQWDIEYHDNQPHGAVFKITGLRANG